MRSDVIWFQESNLRRPPEHAPNCLRVNQWSGNRGNMIELVFKPNLLDQPAVQALVHRHLTHAVAKTAQESAHGLDLSGLQSPDVRFWTLWAADALHAIGAWKQLSATEAELKKMHVVEAVRRRGTGSLLLKHLIDDAQAAGDPDAARRRAAAARVLAGAQLTRAGRRRGADGRRRRRWRRALRWR